MKLFSQQALLGPDLELGPACVHVDGHQITRVERRPDAPDGALDLGRKVLAPAWVNAHTHVALVALRGFAGLAAQGGNMVEELYFRVERNMEPADVKALARVGAVDCLLSGTGAVWDHYYHGVALAEALVECGLAAALAPALQDLDGPGVPLLEDSFQQLQELGKPAWEAQGILPVIGPHATDTVSPALWARCRDLAVQTGWPVHFHVAQSAEEWERIHARHGCSPVQLLQRQGLLEAGVPLLMVHGLYVSEADLDLLDPDLHRLGHCPAAQSQFDFPADEVTWRQRGLKVVLGTDAGSCNDTMDPQAELRMMAAASSWAITQGPEAVDFRRSSSPMALQAIRARRARHLGDRESARELLQRITSLPGDLHPQMPVGRIQAGYWANLQVIDPDSPGMWPAHDVYQALAFSQVQPAIWGLMVRGRWIGEPGNLRGALLGSDWWRQAQQEARGRLEALLRRSGL